MFKLAKMILWIKGHATAIGIVATIVLAIGAGIQVHRANRWEKEALRLDGKLTEQKADQDKLYGEAVKARATRNIEKAEERELRKKLEDRIRAAKKRGRKGEESAGRREAQDSHAPSHGARGADQ